jgi:SOS-response transcriptional repressor LexA
MSTETEKQAFAARFNTALDLFGIPSKNQGRSLMVAELFSLTQRGAARWINGEVYPPKAKRALISQKLEVNQDWLVLGRGEPTLDNPGSASIKSLPVLTLAEATNPQKALENFTGKRIAVNSSVGQYGFMVRSAGLAMTPRFPEGTLLIVDPDVEARDGDFVLAHAAKIPEAIFRQYLKGETGFYLSPVHADFSPIVMGERDKIIGKLVEAKLDFH